MTSIPELTQSPPAEAVTHRLAAQVPVPRQQGRAVRLQPGDVLRIVLTEGPQVADCAVVLLGRSDVSFHIGQSLVHNLFLGLGGPNGLRLWYSAPPHEQVLVEVIADTVGAHCAWLGSRCSSGTHAAKNALGIDQPVDPETAPSCQRNLQRALGLIGVTRRQIGDVYNAFMQVSAEHAFAGRALTFLPPAARVGDYLELQARQPVAVAVSACPNDAGAVNAGRAKGLLLQHWAGPGGHR